jgi:hypothetical protein
MREGNTQWLTGRKSNEFKTMEGGIQCCNDRSATSSK